MSATTTPTKRRTYSITVEAEAYLDDFTDSEIAAYCFERGIRPAPNEVSLINDYDSGAMIERLYYATRGDGPIQEPFASELRAMLRELSGRST